MAQQDDKARAQLAVKQLDRELLKANNLLKQSNALKESLNLIKDNAAKIEAMASQNELVAGALQKEFAQSKVLGYFSELSANLLELNNALKEFEEAQLKTELFLESYRNERAYSFADSEKAVEFIKEAFALYSVSTAFFKPEFIGLVDANKIALELKLEKKDKQYLKLAVQDIGKLFSYLSKSGVAKNFRLDSEQLNFLCKSTATVKAEAESAKIKRLDRLAKSLGGSY